ncbi:hypothetical protein KNE206_32740 [Kitasatospora sp. NE20-6]
MNMVRWGRTDGRRCAPGPKIPRTGLPAQARPRSLCSRHHDSAADVAWNPCTGNHPERGAVADTAESQEHP